MGDLTFDDSVLSALDENGPAASSGPASPGEGADPPHAGGLHMGDRRDGATPLDRQRGALPYNSYSLNPEVSSSPKFLHV